jgi:hypothetical protein
MFTRLRTDLKGFRTMILSGIVIASGSLMYVDQDVLNQVMQALIQNPLRLAIATIAIGMIFGWMRKISDTDVGGNLSTLQNAPIKRGVDQGD